MITSISLSTILITILVILINARATVEDDRWDIIEYIFAVVFGWIAVVYILIRYNKYILILRNEND